MKTCEWTIKDANKYSPLIQCAKPAVWQKEQAGIAGFRWRLCDQHKTMLLKSFNSKTQFEEQRLWKRIVA